MKINTKYEMGQKVYRVVERFRRIENVQTCDICYGTGSINYKGYECQCPKCLGRGNIVLNSEEVSFRKVYEPKEITSVRVTVVRKIRFMKKKMVHLLLVEVKRKHTQH